MEQPTKEIAYLNREIKKFSNDIYLKMNEKRDKIKQICVHPKEHVKTKHKSFSGGYDYVSEYHTWSECEICGSLIETKIDYGSYA